MPSVPMDMPSLTPMVLNLMPSIPASSQPFFTYPPRSRRCMLQGLPSYHTDETPTWGLLMSSGSRPVA